LAHKFTVPKLQEPGLETQGDEEQLTRRLVVHDLVGMRRLVAAVDLY
jgi:hypothetical protein